MEIPRFECYVDYRSENYGLNALRFSDAQGHSYWFSYKTLVAFNIGHGLVCMRNEWGPTTGRHLNAIEPDKKLRVDAEEFQKHLLNAE